MGLGNPKPLTLNPEDPNTLGGYGARLPMGPFSPFCGLRVLTRRPKTPKRASYIFSSKWGLWFNRVNHEVLLLMIETLHYFKDPTLWETFGIFLIMGNAGFISSTVGLRRRFPGYSLGELCRYLEPKPCTLIVGSGAEGAGGFEAEDHRGEGSRSLVKGLGFRF